MGYTKEIKDLRTQQINNFMSQFDDLNYVDVSVITEGLKNILGETPGVDFEYGSDFKLNETTQLQERKTLLSKIHIFYTYEDDDNNIKASRISYIVD